MLLAVMPCCPAHIVSCLAICCVALLEQIDDGDDDARKKKITKAKRTHSTLDAPPPLSFVFKACMLHLVSVCWLRFCYTSDYITDVEDIYRFWVKETGSCVSCVIYFWLA